MNYCKSQLGWFIIVIFIPIIGFNFLAYINQWGSNPLPLNVFLIMTAAFILIASLFYKLTVTFDGSMLKLSYGIGLIRIKFHFDKVEAVNIIETPWYWGFGIRITPKGMLYNIHGSKAVEIVYVKNGKQKSVMVGTPEPEQLKRALEGR